jgi:NSS family neurotransmitter:Na+ symporter
VVDKFGWKRNTVVNVVCVVGFLGSVTFTTQAGLFWLDIADHFLTHYGLVVVGILECVIVAWLFRLDILKKHINRISTIQLGPIWTGLIKFFVPLVLGLILIGDLFQEFRKPYGDYTWGSVIVIGVDWVLLTLIAAVWLSMRPWRTEHHRGASRGEEHL